jgi:predicted Ser/Thr protein kinase
MFYSAIQSSNKRDLWLFGGFDGLSLLGLGDLWKLDVRNNYTWVNYTVEGDKPAPRGESIIWIDSQDNLFIFGGNNDSLGTLTYSDLWMFNSTSMQWNLLRNESDLVRGELGNGTSETHPGPRFGAASWTQNDNELWFFGGIGVPSVFIYSDVWKYTIDSDTWTWMSGQSELSFGPTDDVEYNTPSTTALPGSTYGAGVTQDTDGNVWIMGGRNFETTNQLWRFNPISLEWTLLNGTLRLNNGTVVRKVYQNYYDVGIYSPTAYPPNPLKCPLIYSGDGLLTLVLGEGYDPEMSSSQYLMNLWSYNISSGLWAFMYGQQGRQYANFQQSDLANSPGVRTGFGMIGTGSAWVIRGFYLPTSPTDTFVYSVDVCGTDLDPGCTANATCVDKIGYAECQCKGGYEGDGITCQEIVVAPIVVEQMPPSSSDAPQGDLTPVIVPSVVVPVVVITVGVIVLVVLLKRRKKGSNIRVNDDDFDNTGTIYKSIASEELTVKTETNMTSTTQTMTNPTSDLQSIESRSSNESDRMNIPYSELKIHREIGAGAYGKVFVGEWQMTTVAMKISGYTSSQEFLREAALLINLRPHPNVVQILGVSKSTDGVNTVMIMEYCDGGSLDKVLSTSKMSFATKVQYLSGVAKGLYHLHKNKIIHRDIAARNVLLSRGEAKISDFGMSRKIDNQDAQGKSKSSVGPIPWMAPESIKSMEYSVKSDAWSFGMLCWEVLAEEEPHKNSDALEIGLAIRDIGKTPKIDETWHKDLIELMRECWNVNPDLRPDFKEICERMRRIQVKVSQK